VGNVDAYYRASMDLLTDQPKLNLYDPEWVVYTRSEELPPARLGRNAVIERSLVANGCCVDGTVEHSILFPGVQVEEGSVVRHSILMNGARVASGASLDRVIVDKDVRIGRNAIIGQGETVPHEEYPPLLRNGITIVGRDAVLPDGLVVGRHCVIEPGVGPDDLDGLPVEAGSMVRRGGVTA
jgi:glucose-1-phosphate adenylyltransferase